MIKDVFSTITNGLTSSLANYISTIGKALGGIKDTVTGTFSNAATWLKDADKCAIQGSIKGLESEYGNVEKSLGGRTAGRSGVMCAGVRRRVRGDPTRDRRRRRRDAHRPYAGRRRPGHEREGHAAERGSRGLVTWPGRASRKCGQGLFETQTRSHGPTPTTAWSSPGARHPARCSRVIERCEGELVGRATALALVQTRFARHRSRMPGG